MSGMATTPKALPALASEINAEHEAAERAINDALLHARNAGRLLIEAKAQVQHGMWSLWLDEHFRGSYRTAQRYMRIAGRWSEIEANATHVSHLSLRDALALIAEPRDDESAQAPEPEPVELPPAPAPTNTERLRQLREAQATASAAFDDTPEPELVEDHDDTPEPTPPPATDRSKLVPPRRPYTTRMKALVAAAQDAADASDEEITAVPTNDLMIAGLKRARDLLDRIITHHTSKGRNHVSA